MIRHIVFQTIFFALLYQLNCQSSKMQCKKNAHFLMLVNDIFEEYLLTDKKLQELLEQNERDEKFLIHRDKNLKVKIWKLGCKYTELCLYIMYHIKFDMVDKDDINYDVLEVFRVILHRILSIYYYTIGFTTKEIWYTSITINALFEKKITPVEVNFCYISNIYDFCKVSFYQNNLQNFPRTYDNYPDLSTIYEISKQLKLYSDFYPETFNEIYQYEDVSNVYSFFWDNTDGYKTFIPPKKIFPSYNEYHIAQTYWTACKNWKRKYNDLLLYTDAIKRNLFLVTYFYLALHSIYLINCFSEDFNREDFLNLFKIPLNTISEIGVFSGELFQKPFMGFVDDMKNDKIINQQTLIMYTTKVIHSFNIQARVFSIPYLNLSNLIRNNSKKNLFIHSTVEEQLKLYASDLQKYFENVRAGMAPVDFIILKVFKFSHEYNRI
ncbi:uncharacterized protein LOC126896824 [Daktulosphaira vitifoliae]|uniref:uncharacterized protein LOC126896824 n=1 Tax=Daktulosphaira vitifoliae TaxID=58002 RepID=UPI0021AAA1CA|nr:uncharacterized protein LOC126896824 [Daktulosphaira vitifoliae]